jgi:hypothetical protein
MDLAANRLSTDAQEFAAVNDCFTKWYAANDAVRHLWAVQERGSVIAVYLTLEPTSDGDDALPVWFAKGHQWADELCVLTRCEVQLLLLGSNYERPEISADAMITELSWRDPWIAE